VAEFTLAGDRPLVRRTGRTVETVTPRGGFRLTVTGDTALFSAADGDDRLTLVLAVPRVTLPSPAAGLKVLGPDRDALRGGDRRATLVDLGLGRAAAAFCIRTGDPDVAARLAEEEGNPWEDVLHRAGHQIVHHSPHRVVLTPAGRAEIYTPIPPPGGVSPDGPHTHLLPARLGSGRDLPPGLDLPGDLAPAALYHGSPGWRMP
jgi:hypothetical protein